MIEGRYSCCVSTSQRLYGPYGPRYEAIPYGGHNAIFRDAKGRWWSTYFGRPQYERPAIVPVRFGRDGRMMTAPSAEPKAPQ